MGRIDVYPPFIDSAYNKLPIEQWSEAGLYQWALSHQTATKGVNLIKGSWSSETLARYRSDVFPQSWDSYNWDATHEPSPLMRQPSGLTQVRMAEGQNPSPQDLIISTNQTYALSILRARLTDMTLQYPRGGTLRAVARWLEGSQVSAYNTKTLPKSAIKVWDVRKYTGTNPAMSVDIENPATGVFTIGERPSGVLATNQPYLSVGFDTRLLLGMPTGTRFDTNGGSGTVGAGWFSDGFWGYNDKYLTFEALLRTGITAGLATEQLIMGLPYLSTSWGFRVYLSNGNLYITHRNANHIVMENVPADSMLHLVIMVNNDPSTAASNPERGAIRVFANGKLVFNIDTGNTGTTEVRGVVLGANLNSSTQRNYFRGSLHHFRMFNKFLDDSYAQEFWNGGKPEEYIMPFSYQAKGNYNIMESEENCYGCVFELLPQNIDMSNEEAQTWFSSSLDKQGYNSYAWPTVFGVTQGPIPVRTYLNPSTGAPPTVNLRALYDLQWDKMMFYAVEDKILPWQFTPTELLSRVDPDDDTIDPVKIDLYDDNSYNIARTVTVERAADSDGIARFDLSYIVRQAFLHKQILAETTILGNFYIDFNLVGRYRINSDNALFKYFIREIAQWGDTLDLTTSKLLSSRVPIRYPGYPLDVAAFVPVISSASYRISLSYSNGTVSYSPPYPVMLIGAGMEDYPERKGAKISFSKDGVWGEPILIPDACVPEDPFYVRWINDLGGYDYEMFDRARNIEDEVANIQSIQKTGANPYHTQETIYAEGYTYVTVGRNDLKLEDYTVLKKLARSPLIQVWNVDQKQWHTIILSDETTNERNTRSGVYSIEFTFQLPRIKMQF